MEELKSCPVCGATKGLYILEDYHEFEWYVFCDNCKTSLCNENAQTKEEAINIWNTRYERTTPANELLCRHCGYSIVYQDDDDIYTWDYCPHCGAKIVE